MTALATFGGGCFWCMEPPFDALPGVLSTTSGYMGGTTSSPTYEQVCTGRTGHAEVVQVSYDPARVSYRQLLDAFWRNIDPTQVNGQFADHGSQYRTAIFFHDEEQRRQAEESKLELGRSGVFDAPIVTEIVPASTFWPAEDYHQKYYEKCSLPYKRYRAGSGREGFLARVWGGPEKKA